MNYKGFYKDETGTTEIIIYNDFKCLSVEIDGVKFQGREFSDLIIIDKEKYSSDQRKRFTFYPTAVYGTEIIEESLCNCSFHLTIPQVLIDLKVQEEFLTELTVDYFLGKERPKPQRGIDREEMIIFTEIENKKMEGRGGYIEDAFDALREQFGDRYKFKNCYGCLYSDYSVYGNSAFGSMLCYVNQKEEYLKVKSKDDYLKLTNDFAIVQEIYCCDKFEIRKASTGYRG